MTRESLPPSRRTRSHGPPPPHPTFTSGNHIQVSHFIAIRKGCVMKLTSHLIWNIKLCTREYGMIYRGSGFLASVWFGSSATPTPLYRQQVDSLSQSSCDWPVELTDRRRWARSQFIRWLESMVFYKSFNDLCSVHIIIIPFPTSMVFLSSPLQPHLYSTPSHLPSCRL
jgi:hypothetical protein